MSGVDLALTGESATLSAVYSALMSAADLTAAGEGASVIPGAVALTMSVADLAGSAETMDLSAVATILMSAADLTTSPELLGVVPGAVSIALSVADLVAGAFGATIVVPALKIDVAGTDAVLWVVLGTDAAVGHVTGGDKSRD